MGAGGPRNFQTQLSQSRGVHGERQAPFKLPGSALEDVRREMDVHSAYGGEISLLSSRLSTQNRLDTQKSIRMYNRETGGALNENGQSRRDQLLAPLSARVPSVFKGGRSFPLGRGGTDHRQMLGIPSTSNNPAVVAAREALQRRFRTTVEAYAFLHSVKNADASVGHDWVECLNVDSISKGFQMLRVRVDVPQLMLQISDKDQRLSLMSSRYSSGDTLSAGGPAGANMARPDGSTVSFESWNQQMAWHPPLQHPGRSLAEARAGLQEIRATATRAAAAMSTMKASTWRTPVSQKEIQDTLGFVHDSRELFDAFSVPPKALADARERALHSQEEYLLTFRDMEALYRQVHVLPGWITSQGLAIIFQEVAAQDMPTRQVPGKMHSLGVTFEQHQECVELISKRLRLTVGSDLKHLGPDYRQPLDVYDMGVCAKASTAATKEKKRLTNDTQVVRAFAKIYRAIVDEKTFLRFCSAPTTSPPAPIALSGNSAGARGSTASSGAEHLELPRAERAMELSDCVDLLRSLGLVAK